jgi:hypothetical protein
MAAGEQTRFGAPDRGAIVSVAVRTMPPRAAVMVALPDALALTAALKPAVDPPAGIGTEAGTLTCGLLLASDTFTPPCPAGPLKDTVQVLEVPTVRVSGVQVTEEREDWLVTASEKVTDEPAKLAVRIADPAEDPVAVKIALVVPDGTVTDAGTDAEELPLANATATPPEGAVVDRYIVQVAVAPGAIDPGMQDKLDKVTAG